MIPTSLPATLPAMLQDAAAAAPVENVDDKEWQRMFDVLSIRGKGAATSACCEVTAESPARCDSVRGVEREQPDAQGEET
jgi:hypothetical protein